MSTDRDPAVDQPLPKFYPGAVSCVAGANRFLNIRDEFGTRKYGVTLSSPNGRNFVIDQLEESSDGMVYAVGAAFQDYLLRGRLLMTAVALRRMYGSLRLAGTEAANTISKAMDLADDIDKTIEATGGWERSRALAEQMGWRE